LRLQVHIAQTGIAVMARVPCFFGSSPDCGMTAYVVMPDLIRYPSGRYTAAILRHAAPDGSRVKARDDGRIQGGHSHKSAMNFFRDNDDMTGATAVYSIHKLSEKSGMK
jgi:hypothetical protein